MGQNLKCGVQLDVDLLLLHIILCQLSWELAEAAVLGVVVVFTKIIYSIVMSRVRKVMAFL